MRIVSESPDRLVLQDQPGCFWLLGLFFVAIGGFFIVGLLGAFTNLSDVSLVGRVVAGIMATTAVAAGLHIIRGAPLSRLELDRARQTLTVKNQGMFQSETVVYPLAEVAEVFVVTDADSDGDAIFRLGALLRGGREILLSRLWLHDRAGLELAADALRAGCYRMQDDNPTL